MAGSDLRIPCKDERSQRLHQRIKNAGHLATPTAEVGRAESSYLDTHCQMHDIIGYRLRFMEVTQVCVAPQPHTTTTTTTTTSVAHLPRDTATTDMNEQEIVE
ncbi:hypothetical protein Btru_044071 [Bulinus truncatus]|nr:hypothetical protein Btru_044071 [Bulinus truncatus]